MDKEPRQKKSTKARKDANEIRVGAVFLGDGGIGKAFLNRKLANKANPYIWNMEHWGYWEFHSKQFDISEVPSIDEIRLRTGFHTHPESQPNHPPNFKSQFQPRNNRSSAEPTVIRPGSLNDPNGETEVVEQRQDEDKFDDKHKGVKLNPGTQPNERLGGSKQSEILKAAKEPNKPSTSCKIWLDTYSIRAKLSENIEVTLRNVYRGMAVIGLCYKISDKGTLENAVYKVILIFELFLCGFGLLKSY
jgi:hypothetical protein